MALFQIPAGLLAERFGERVVLAAGTAVTAAGFVVAGWAGGFLALGLVLLGAGLGSGVQHPLSSSLVSRAYETGARRTALGTYNFAGDLGKVALPAVVALGSTVIGWRLSAGAFGVLGIAGAFGLAVLLGRLAVGHPEPRTAPGSAGLRRLGHPRRARLPGALGHRHDRQRHALAVPHVPALPLDRQGLTVAGVGGAFALLFAGGAVGKFACGLLAERIGVIRAVVFTEAVTAIGIITVVAAPLGWRSPPCPCWEWP